MIEKEKVINGLEHCRDLDIANMKWPPGTCPYYDISNERGCCLYIPLINDAIARLREQESVTMEPVYVNYVCSGCKTEINGEFIDYYMGGKINFCPECGRKVKWDE